MKKIFFFFIISIVIFSSCSNSENELLKKENVELKEKLDELNKKQNTYTKEFAIQTFQDYLNFYHPDCSKERTDFDARKFDAMTFDISYKYKHAYYGWQTLIIRLSFTDDNKNIVTTIKGLPGAEDCL